MTAIEQAEELRQQAITILLDERDAIGQKLTLLGYEQKSPDTKRRGRPPKGEASVHSDTTRTPHSEPPSSPASDTLPPFHQDGAQ